MKNKTINLINFLNLFLPVFFFLLTFFILNPISSLADNGIQVNFFWGDGCPHCAKVEPVIETLETKYPQVKFNSYEIYHNKGNALLLYQLYDQYKAPEEDQGRIPIVFVNGKYFIGDKSIIDNLETEIIKALSLVKKEEKIKTITPPTPVIEKNNTEEIKDIAPPAEMEDAFANEQVDRKSYTLWAIAGAAIVDSINPCAIAVLLILLTALMVGAGDRKRALIGGLFFTLAIYLAYFLFGLGLLQLIAITNLSGIIAKIVGVLALIIGLANIKDFFFYGGCGCVMEIPRSWRPTLKKILGGVTSPAGAFLAGFVVTLFELPCTGGPYFFVIGLLSQAESVTSILPTLLFYNLVFVLPLLLIVFIVYFGISSVERANEWKEKNIRLLHLIAGIIMLALGIWVLLV
jgi:cytochrome c biogenesis protein CcdA